MTELGWEILFVSIAGAASTLFVLAYGMFARWWRTPIGRALMASDLSLAVLLDLALAAYWLHFEVPAWGRLAIDASIAAAALMRLGAVVTDQILKRHTP